MKSKLARGRAEACSEKCGLRHDKNALLLVALKSGLGLILAGQVTAQTFTTLYTFTGGNDGGSPQAGLILSGNTLYGTASQYGSLSFGTVFKLNTDGTGFKTLYSFAGSPSDGSNPQAALMLSGNTLFGTASAGGNAGNGTLFSLNIDGTGFITLYSFSANYNAGASPEAGLMLSANALYGTTAHGGYWNLGKLFRVYSDGSGYLGLHDFGGPDGATPYAGLLLSSGTLYGTTQQGGASGNGTVFELSTASSGSGFAILYSFTQVLGPSLTNSDGGNPQAALILSSNTLYGTTSAGGGSGIGTVFKIKTNGTAFATLHAFTGNDGASPNAGLILSGNTLYGTTYSGGSYGSGTIFAVNIDGTGFTNLYDFTGGTDGANPQATLILSANKLYGTASTGGSSFFGTVFSLLLGPVSPPHLGIISAGTNVILTWTNTVTGFTLQSTTNLASPTAWASVSPGPVVVNGQNTVTNAISASQRFFRLSQ